MILMMTMMGIYNNSYDEDDDNCAEAILNGASIDRIIAYNGVNGHRMWTID